MRNDFINKVYNELNHIINHWAKQKYLSDKIFEYTNTFSIKKVYGFYWEVKILCKNDYRILLRFYKNYEWYNDSNILNVSVLAPAVERVENEDGSVDVYPSKKIKDKIEFIEGNFDIDGDDWVDEVLEYINKWVNKDKADVEVLNK